ncbi:hypothetical protein [Paenibacillus gorillae]|uniref:hypothetical protein n=1 Tax=Paenibacillus gorillae TaxID=1243662 RepID=UPI0004B2DF68|nr:hypothetical protein [Paenibacillus gorillae]
MATKPGESQYEKWLATKHRIVCWNDPMLLTACKKDGETIEWRSKGVTTGFFTLKVRDRYRGADRSYEIYTIGLFGRFIDYSVIKEEGSGV